LAAATGLRHRHRRHRHHHREYLFHDRFLELLCDGPLRAWAGGRTVDARHSLPMLTPM